MSILVALWLTLKAPGRNWQMRANCKMASSLLWAPRLLRFARPKPWISSILGGPFCVPVLQSEIHILGKKRDKRGKEISWRGGAYSIFFSMTLFWWLETYWFVADLLFSVCLFYCCAPTSLSSTPSHDRITKGQRCLTYVSIEESGWICWVHRKKRSAGTGGLAPAPHLPRVSGCRQHPITHPYHFATPAPLSLDIWHEGHSVKRNLQVTHVVLL